MYKLNIFLDCDTSIDITGSDFNYVVALQKAIKETQENRIGQIRKEMMIFADKLLDDEVRAVKPPAKKRGRPVGSKSKAKTAQ
jgi:hypothetical protein